ncbi:MAG: A/G-specific adenine glycosylase [Alphaproteobacteria bacterium]|nr:MAG: A/G-specific adenine glycosylase [Alphaproteobacteria bacterium]
MTADPDDLLDWYDRHARRLPWRAPPGSPAPDPYAVWLSEVMLQQTTVAAVIPYFEQFIARWPTVHDLAAAPLDDVLAAWAGLGYYARARNLHKCAQLVANEMGGRFPDTEEALKALPGIGAYTAAAIAAIAFDRPATVVDVNVERVIARLFAVQEPLPDAKPGLRERAATLTPSRRPGDYAQAVMDLGATICTPKAPKCPACPWRSACLGHRRNVAASLPRRAARVDKPVRRGIAYWLEAPDPQTGAPSVLLRRRTSRGLLGGMTEFPSKGWSDDDHGLVLEGRDLDEVVAWSRLGEPVRHTFTHFHLELEVRAGRLKAPVPVSGATWFAIDDLKTQALPSVMRKVARRALGARGGARQAQLV